MSKPKAYVGDIPFDGNGNQQHYPSSWVDKTAVQQENEDDRAFWRRRYQEAIMMPNHTFEDTLTYEGFSRGRSAAYFELRRKDGRQVTVFLTDFEDMIKRMVRGTVTGTFTFCKRGGNYGCKLVPA